MTNKKLYALTDAEIADISELMHPEVHASIIASMARPITKVYLVEARWLADTQTGMDQEVMMVALSVEQAIELIKTARAEDPGRPVQPPMPKVRWWCVTPEAVGTVDVNVERSKFFDLDGNTLESQPWDPLKHLRVIAKNLNDMGFKPTV